MERKLIKEIRIGDRYAVINEGVKHSEFIIKVDKIDFDNESYADCIIHYKIGEMQESCRLWWIDENCLLISEKKQ